MTVTKVVNNHHIITGLQATQHGVRTNVARTTRNQYRFCLSQKSPASVITPSQEHS
jgi:hypothetical protein